ncbi:MAG TPA: acyltransferase domain-containing protein, partial [Polyangium sp.]|nr:acyltransferase domain-containing protein [Polyangium sp.]
MASGRLSYVLGLKGPSMTIDTACSSSLVTVHLACRSLRAGECNVALAGGATVMLTPMSFVEFSRLRGLSPDGRCKSFSADANGAGWAEGCGMLVLKRLSDAKRDGDRVLAVLRGSAVNQDGRSNGLTAPNGPSQQRVIRRALATSGLLPADIDALEAHGTGTKLGDPIEAGALIEVFGSTRRDDMPLWLGSSKSNIGHAQAAAGVLGVIKMVLALQHERLPRTIHAERPSPHIAWDESGLRLLQEPQPWPRRQAHVRRAGISSFGVSGTNAHVILEEAPSPVAAPEIPARSSELVVLSAKTSAALDAQAKRLVEHLNLHAEFTLRDLAYSLATTRSAMEHRLAIAVTSRETLQRALEDVARGQTPTGTVRQAIVGGQSPELVFVFPGQGSQWVGMGRQLHREEGVFREVLSACDEAIRAESGFSIIEELDKPADASRIHETIVAQPALFAIEVALYALLRSWGVTPSAVIGHSVGEIAAAHVSGMLDLGQAARLVCVRARVMQKSTGRGKMVSVSLDEQAAAKAIAGLEGRIGIAALNDPNSVVLSGDIATIDSVVARLSHEGVQTRPLRVNYAFHSPQMEPLLAEFVEALGVVQVKPAMISMISTVTGKPVADGELDVGYWGRNIRQTVRFGDAVVASQEHVFVEVGPHPVLSMSIEQTLVAKNIAGYVIPTLRRDKDERQHALLALGALHTVGVRIDWKTFFPDGGHVVELPTYPWQKQRYWLETTATGEQIRASTQSTGPDRRIAAQALRERLLGLSENERHEVMLDLVRREIAAIAGLPSADAVPADQPLQALGLDSLMTFELRNRLTVRAETTLPATLAFDYPTAQAIAGLLLRKVFVDLEPARSQWVEVLTTTRPHIAPLSSDQARLAFLDRVLNRRETYSLCLALHIDAALDPERLQRALSELIPRYDQLRMHLVDTADGPMQRILPWVDIPIAVHDLRNALDPNAAFADLSNRLAAIPFDLYRAPLMTMAFACLSAQASGLVLIWHHIATDGWSLGTFFAALSQTYQALEKGPIDPARLIPVPSYVSLMAARRMSMAPSQHAAHVAWWKEHLMGAEPLELPIDHRRGASEPTGAIFPFLLHAPLAADIESLGRGTGSSAFAVLLTAWATVLQRHSGQNAPCIGVLTSGRTEPESNRAIGLFVKTLPIRVVLDNQRAIADAIVASHRWLFEAMAHQELALGEILALVPKAVPIGASDANPLLRATIVLEDAAWFANTFAGVTARVVGESVSGDVAGTAKFEISLALIRAPDGFRASIEYRADLFERTTIERLAAHLRQTLLAMTQEPTNRMSAIDILTAAERHQILVEWNDTAQPFPQDICIQQIFEQQVQKTPNAIAVVSQHQRLTYAELDTRANQLAHHLRSLGVGPEAHVGICLERSTEMLVAILAVLKAGGAYVPLDPTYPVERLRFMAEDAGLRVLLMQPSVSFELPANVHCIDVFAVEENLAKLPNVTPKNVIVPENNAYVIYTSGSTGKPKGVELSHRGGVAFLSWIRSEFNREELMGVVASTSISFDVSFFELFAPFLFGGAVLLVPDALSLQTLGKHSPPPTMLVTVPSAIRTLLQGPGIPQTIRALNLAGEALDQVT